MRWKSNQSNRKKKLLNHQGWKIGEEPQTYEKPRKSKTALKRAVI
jgi:hypothetical protein